MNKTKNIVFIIYDSIYNSVFKSQVLAPIKNLLKNKDHIKITLISFEKNKPSQKSLKAILKNNKINFICLKRLPFFGTLSLYFAYMQIKKILDQINPNRIICRGPLAGWIALKSTKNNSKKNILIQARGLCAQEYRFAAECKKETYFKKLFRTFVYKKLEKIEKEVFKKNKSLKVTIESVSPALSAYLVKTFNANYAKIKIASKDIPKKINVEDRIKFRKTIRNQLEISNKKIVYCYSGSAKPWQCVEKSIDYFAKQCKKNKNLFLLIFTQDKKKIETIIASSKIAQKDYKILCVNPNELIKYLCACDYGFLFRKKDVINFVSRPTKLLEYQSAGLKIIHNGTISLLADKIAPTCPSKPCPAFVARRLLRRSRRVEGSS